MRLRSAPLLVGAALAGCAHHAEPRWLVRMLPGSYPEVVYFVPTAEPAIALTIDDGVDAATTPLILDVLHEHDATATFFLVSNSVSGNEALVGRIVAEGHEIGHHMTEDQPTASLPPEELTEKFFRAAGTLERFAPITWFRPGSGRYNRRIVRLTRERNYRIALASVFPLDTLMANPSRVAAYVRRMVRPGSVIVLHDVGDRGRRSVETLELLLPEFRNDGVKVLSLSGLEALATKR